MKELAGRPGGPPRIFCVDDLPNNLAEYLRDLRPEAVTQDPQMAELARLDTVVGLGSVKEHLRGIHAQLLMDRRRRDAGLACASHGSLHMIFTGNPGTGKVRLASSYSLVCRVSHKSDCFAACLIQNIPLYHEWCL